MPEAAADAFISGSRGSPLLSGHPDSHAHRRRTLPTSSQLGATQAALNNQAPPLTRRPPMKLPRRLGLPPVGPVSPVSLRPASMCACMNEPVAPGCVIAAVLDAQTSLEPLSDIYPPLGPMHPAPMTHTSVTASTARCCAPLFPAVLSPPVAPPLLLSLAPERHCWLQPVTHRTRFSLLRFVAGDCVQLCFVLLCFAVDCVQPQLGMVAAASGGWQRRKHTPTTACSGMCGLKVMFSMHVWQCRQWHRIGWAICMARKLIGMCSQMGKMVSGCNT